MRASFVRVPSVLLLTVFAVISGAALFADAPAAGPAAPTGSTGSTGTTGSTGSAAATGSSGATGTTGSQSIPAALIASVSPAAPLTGPNRPLTLQGSGFVDKLSVAFTDPEGNTPETARVVKVAGDHVDVAVTLAEAGKWKVTATNPGGSPSPSFEFSVAAAPAVAWDSPAVLAFGVTLLIVTALLGLLFGVMLHDLMRAQKAGQWSFGDALSQTSSFQPKEIRQRSDVILIPSSSRLIALLGLLGILATVIGIGFSIMWNLFIYGTVPDLSEVRNFLYGAACLFAPYLANKLGEVLPSSHKQTKGDAPASVSITGVSPTSLRAAAGSQQLQITGSGFQSGLTLTLTDPQQNSQNVSGGDIASVDATLVQANVTLATPGSWQVAVANPSAAPSAAFTFSVAGPPTITAVDPAAPASKADAQDLAFVGAGFVSGLTVSLTVPGATAASAVKAKSVTSTRVSINTVLAGKGQAKVVITNPGDGNNASAEFPFTVS